MENMQLSHYIASIGKGLNGNISDLDTLNKRPFNDAKYQFSPKFGDSVEREVGAVKRQIGETMQRMARGSDS
jgi:hypothetical protein